MIDEATEPEELQRRLNVRSKLLIMLLSTSLVSISVVAWIGYNSGREMITQNVVDGLAGVRSTKKQLIEWYFDNLRENFTVFGNDVAVVSALSLLQDGYVRLPQEEDASAHSKALKEYYNDEQYRSLTSESVTVLRADDITPRTARGKILQSMYIVQNPFKKDRKELTDHPISNTYTLAHNIYHGWFRDLAQRFDFYDVFLIDGESGNIVYSVAKEIDIGTSLIDGPHANTNFGKLIRNILNSDQSDIAHISDYSFYMPSNNEPALFIATPVFSKWKFVGIIAAQISVEALNGFMTNNNKWSESWFGDTGEVYIVGSDKLMRTDSRFMAQDPLSFVRTLKQVETPPETIDRMQKLNSTILLNRVDTAAVEDAFEGRDGTRLITDYRGVPVLSSYAPLAIPGLNWAVITEIDKTEAFEPLVRFGRKVTIAACFLALVFTVMATFFANRFLRPVKRLLEGMESLRSGNREVHVEQRSNDEFGALIGSFNQMVHDINTRDSQLVSQENAYAALLKRIFPSAVADRMRGGDVSFVESVPNVTVVNISVNGLSQADDVDDGKETFDMRNEVVNAFDTVSDNKGVEKVKSTGEHYVAVCGLSEARLDHAKRAFDFVVAISKELDRLNRQLETKLTISVAMASGVVHAGLIGNRRFVYDVWGRPCNIAQHIVNEAGVNEVRVSEDTAELLGRASDVGNAVIIENRALGRLRTFRIPLVEEVQSGLGQSSVDEDSTHESMSRTGTI